MTRIVALAALIAAWPGLAEVPQDDASMVERLYACNVERPCWLTVPVYRSAWILRLHDRREDAIAVAGQNVLDSLDMPVAACRVIGYWQRSAETHFTPTVHWVTGDDDR